MLWSELAASLDTNFHWLLIGDFNMVEYHADHVGGEGQIIRGREARAWKNLAKKYNLTDTFTPREGHLRFSWDNQRVHRHNPANVDELQFGPRILRRIDRIYAPQLSRGFSTTVTSIILPGYSLSDHAPVVASLKSGGHTCRPTRHRMSMAHLRDPTFVSRLVRSWELGVENGLARGWDPEKILHRCLIDAHRADRCWGKRRAKEKRQRREVLQARVKRAQIALEFQPDSPTIQLELREAREMLQALDHGMATWTDQVIQARWIADGDSSSKLFYKSFKSMSASKHIHSILDSNGNPVTTWEEMAEQVETFFRNTFGGTTEEQAQNVQRRFQDQVLSSITDRLTPAEKAQLNEPISLGELEGAMLAMKSHKCPGHGGAPVEFFKTCWPTIGPLVLQVLNRGIQREEFQSNFTLGLIVLLPKKNDQRLLSNKRPITLLNVIYKLGAKAMQRRLSPILQRIISHQQFAFLPGRNIHHSLVLLGEMLQQAEASGDEHILLKMDVIKAFDRLEWPFLLAVLEKCGMNGTLSSFMKASFANASSTILLNGRLTERIPLTRSV